MPAEKTVNEAAADVNQAAGQTTTTAPIQTKTGIWNGLKSWANRHQTSLATVGGAILGGAAVVAVDQYKARQASKTQTM